MAILRKVMKGPNEIVPFDHPAIKYPQLASTKFDGFRCLNLCGERLLSPALKDIPNRQLALHLENLLIACRRHRIVTDGEIWSPEFTFSELSSLIRSHDKTIPAHVGYYIFDTMSEAEWDSGTEEPFINRFFEYSQTLSYFPHVHAVEQWHMTCAEEAEVFFNGQIEIGNEGMILRQQNARYKHGRTTLNEDGLWKFKQFITHDAVIVAVEERLKMKLGIERTINEIGQLEREHSQQLYEPAGMVGAIIVDWNGSRFGVKPGKGYNHSDLTTMWQQKNALIGKHCEFKYMPHGSKDKPRIGSLVRMRPDLD